ncbi:putative ATP synthase subunit H [Lyophyllum shimeji]|uniref:ATP synthase subunit H n=1 Tax=Lyophyllum shimeji TaxID=47721 RepID=A0A9P3PRI9_LYOSH|nr:putative ATP synthase subunit H [Lyophyllum shimeji]
MASILPVPFVLVVVVALMTCAALFTPKGPHQTTIRSSIMIALVACYLLWAITYLAQLHPLIAPILYLACNTR